MACKEGQFDVVELMVNDLTTFSINLNAQHVNAMTPLYVYQILQNSKTGNFQWNVVGRTLLEH